MLIAICLALLGAITFRLRGSGLWDRVTRTGTIGGRAQYAIVMALATAAAAQDPWLLLLAPALYLGAVPGWWEDSLLPATEKRFWLNALRGVVWLLPASVVLLFLGYDFGALTVIGGLASAPIYWAAWKIPLRPIRLDGEVVIGRGTELAEVMFGAWIGLLLWAAVAFGG